MWPRSPLIIVILSATIVVAALTGKNFYHQTPTRMNPVAGRHDLQDRLIDYLLGITGAAIA
jgi:hypothetical protein